jgi:hypothetical protein
MTIERTVNTLPIEGGDSVTPNDSVDLARQTRGVYVGVAGDLKVTMVAGDVLTFVGLAAGLIHPIQVTRVWATGTTATSILALW